MTLHTATWRYSVSHLTEFKVYFQKYRVHNFILGTTKRVLGLAQLAWKCLFYFVVVSRPYRNSLLSILSMAFCTMLAC